TDTALTGINTLRNHPPHTTNTNDSGQTPGAQNPASARTTHNSQNPNTQDQNHNTNPEGNPHLDGFTDELNTRPATPSDAP
ncbi:hypothetical protein, partial [Nocardiopsis sp. LOL_012]|uniref:hypothetical protein n=1 Tax=Nocardiopsis sp. LOL_012 TaxID=3345409 RepID=UPI003A8A99EF